MLHIFAQSVHILNKMHIYRKFVMLGEKERHIKHKRLKNNMILNISKNWIQIYEIFPKLIFIKF